MQADLVREATRELFYSHYGGQVVCELKGFAFEIFVVGIVLEIFVIVMRDHRDTTSRRADDGVVRFENLDEALCQRSDLIRTAGVDHWLTAAGLAFGIVDFDTEMLEDFQSGNPHLWEQLINITGDKQANFGRHGRKLIRGFEGFSIQSLILSLL